MKYTLTKTKKIAATLIVAMTISPAVAFGGPGKPGMDTIVKIAQDVNADSGEFSYLLGAVGCLTADDGSNPVAALLSGTDKYTLFAPTDEAFKAVQRALGVAEGDEDPSITCAALDDATIFNILAYHVTEGRRFSNSVFNKNNMKMIEMLNGGYIISNPDITLTDNSGQAIGIVAPLFNLNASNGVIHVIDTVLLP